MRLPLILLTILTALAALGQPAFRFHLVQNVEGFPLKDINCIVEDDKGFLWFGGPYGLYRWDGVTASLFAHDPADPASLTYGAVSHLLKSRNGGLWVGTYRGGLSFMDWETQKSKNYLRDPNIRGSLVGNMVTGLYEDRQNRLWVGTDRFALHRLDPGKEEFIAYHPPFPTDSSWTSISAGPLGEIVPDIENPDLLWLGSRFGIYEFNTATGQFRLYPFEFPVEFWYSTRHLELYGDTDGVVWAGSSQNGLFAFDTKKRAWTHQQLLANAKLDQKVAINAILSYDSLHILVVSPSTQLCLLNRRSGEYTYYVNPGSQFRTGFRSRTGSWWMGATTGLILMSEHLEPFPFYFFGKLPAPALNNWQRAFALSRDGRHLYVGTLRGFGLLIWDWEKDEWQTASFHKVLDLDHTDLLIDALWVDPDGKLWIGSEDGLLERSDDPGRLHRVEGPEKGVGAFQGKHILSICSQQNKLWVGTNGQGLHSFDPFTRQIDRLEAPPVISESCIVNKILEDPSGLVWVGHDQGLSVYDPKDGTWQHYQRKNSPLSHNYVMDLELDKEGILWIATMGGGLNSIDLGQGRPWRFSLFRNQEVAGGNIIYDLVPTPQGQLWMGCESGISRFDPKAGVFVNYDLRQGMFAKIGAFTQLPNGYLASGANRGFHYFHPDSVVARISPPVPYLKEFKVFDRVRLPGTDGPTPHVELGSNENYFSFQVGALNPTVFARNSYAYMLEGRDKDWSYSGERSYFSYTHLPAGRYRFLVKVANQHGQWSAVTPLLAVRILPPFWQTPWFVALAVLVLAAVIYANYRFFRRQYQLRATQRIIDYFAASTYPNLTVEAVLWDIARNCVGSMGFEDCVIYLLDEERGVLVQKAAHGPKSPQPFKIEQPMEIRMGEGIVGTVALSGKAEMVPDTSRDKRYIPDDQVRLSELAVPILDDGKVTRSTGTSLKTNRKRRPNT
ncbi:MAG: hypothetical protein IPJ00_13790 [Saprospirales bacterium]|nr:hypothetical protein [Saprospirales bacterium]